MKYIHLIFAVMLLTANTSCAASYDCAKASTKVEKMICADPELSKLDEDLSTTYSKALKKSSDPSSLKQQQRGWMKERNKCHDAKCLMSQYQARISALESFSVEQITKVADETVSESEIKYPPYPDVWGYELPYPAKNDRDAISGGYLNSDGEISLLYKTDIKMIDGSHKFKYVLLKYFSGRLISFPSDNEVNDFDAKNRKNNILLIGESEPAFSDGLRLKHEGYSHNCYRSFPYHLQVIAKNGEVMVSKYLIYLRDTPRIRYVTSYCEMADGKESFNESVESLYGSIVMLQDDTFIYFENGGNVILRMDKNLETKFKSRHLFIVNAEVIDGIKKSLSEKGNLNFQSLNDAVADYLKALGKGK